MLDADLATELLFWQRLFILLVSLVLLYMYQNKTRQLSARAEKRSGQNSPGSGQQESTHE